MDSLLIVILVVIVGAAGWYVYKAKKSGKKCVGCPDGGSCGCGGKEHHCSCHSDHAD